MINKQKLWFLTLFSIILVLSTYYIALPEEKLTTLLESNNTKSNETKIETNELDALTSIKIENEETVLNELLALDKIITASTTTSEEKSDAYDKIKTINNTKSKENYLENIIQKQYNIKSFIKIEDDQIKIIISSKNNNIKDANNIIRTIQKEFNEKKYITVKYQ